MSALLIILVVTILLIIGAGILFFWAFSQKQTAGTKASNKDAASQEKREEKAGFRWNHILLPLSILVLSIIIAFVFYGKLPDQVVTRNTLVNRGVIMIWAILPQILLTLMSVTIAWGTSKIHLLIPENEPGAIRIETVMAVMSNMVAIPQLILFFVMLDIFTFNAFEKHISFLWAFTLSIILIGIVILGVFFIRTIRTVRKNSK
jgi:nitrogen fixation-related uncharacterized protein